VKTASSSPRSKKLPDKARSCWAAADYATTIRLRAERRAGEILIDMKETRERDPGGRNKRIELHPETQLPTLTDLGVTKTQSFRWRKLAELPPNDFDKTLVRSSKRSRRVWLLLLSRRRDYVIKNRFDAFDKCPAFFKAA
jgi:hypothetical protein